MLALLSGFRGTFEMKRFSNLYLSFTGRFKFFPPGPDDHVVIVGPEHAKRGSFSHCYLQSPDHDVDENLVVRVNQWLEDASAGLPPLARAAFRSHGPYLTGWATRVVTIARQLEATLQDFEADRYVVTHLPGSYHPIVVSYLRSHGLRFSFQRGLSPIRRLSKQVKTVLRKQSRMMRKFRPTEDRAVPFHGDILVASFQSNATRSFLPVARELREQGVQCEFLLLKRDRASRQLLEQDFWPYHFVGDRRAKKTQMHSEETYLELVDRLSEPRLHDLFEAVGFPEWVSPKLVYDYLVPHLRRRLERSYDDALTIDANLEDINPDGVVYITRRAMMDELLRTRSDSTKRIFYLQGIVPEIPPVFTPLEVDLALVGSQLDIGYTDRCGIERNRLRVCGYADFDHYPEISKAEALEELELAFPQASGRPFVVFTSQYKTDVFPDWAREANLKAVIECARKSPEFYFLLKPHPLKERISPSMSATLPENVIFSTAFSTTTALAGSAVAMTYWSTTALEAVLLGTPLVQVNTTGLPDFFDLSADLERQVARDSEQMKTLILEAIQHPELFQQQRSRFLEKMQVRLDGKAAARAARDIRNLFGPESQRGIPSTLPRSAFS